jgi:hypothetical protein
MTQRDPPTLFVEMSILDGCLVPPRKNEISAVGATLERVQFVEEGDVLLIPPKVDIEGELLKGLTPGVGGSSGPPDGQVLRTSTGAPLTLGEGGKLYGVGTKIGSFMCQGGLTGE